MCSAQLSSAIFQTSPSSAQLSSARFFSGQAQLSSAQQKFCKFTTLLFTVVNKIASERHLDPFITVWSRVSEGYTMTCNVLNHSFENSVLDIQVFKPGNIPWIPRAQKYPNPCSTQHGRHQDLAPRVATYWTLEVNRSSSFCSYACFHPFSRISWR